jgi:hypothetical protein
MALGKLDIGQVFLQGERTLDTYVHFVEEAQMVKFSALACSTIPSLKSH